jgi:hypothetical protein
MFRGPVYKWCRYAKVVEGSIPRQELMGFVAQSNKDQETFLQAMAANKMRVTVGV